MSTRPIFCLAVILGGLLFSSSALAASREPLYVRYEKMTDEQKEKLVKKYVRKKKGFYVVSVSRYIVHTDIGDEYALRTAILMDEFYNKFTSVFKGRFSNQGRPKLYVYSTRAGYLSDAIRPPAWSGGCYSPGNGTLYTFKQYKLQETLFHEGTHQLLHSYMGYSDMPLWFNEGCATNFETWDLEYSGGENRKRSPTLSTYRSTMAKLAEKDNVYDIDRVFGYNHDNWGRGRDEEIRIDYATAWSLVNYLLSSKKNIGIFNKILMGIKKQRPMTKVISYRDRVRLEEAWHEDVETRMIFNQKYVVRCLASLERKNVTTEKVLEHLESAPDNMKELLDYKYYHGYILSLLDKNEEALVDLMAVEDEESEYPRLFELIGRISNKLEKYKDAAKYIRIALKVRPGDEELKALSKEVSAKLRAKR